MANGLLRLGIAHIRILFFFKLLVYLIIFRLDRRLGKLARSQPILGLGLLQDGFDGGLLEALLRRCRLDGWTVVIIRVVRVAVVALHGFGVARHGIHRLHIVYNDVLVESNVLLVIVLGVFRLLSLLFSHIVIVDICLARHVCGDWI